MAGNRRRTATLPKKPAVEEQDSDKQGSDDDAVIAVDDDDSSFESEIDQIRRRWELASVLNFLMTFEPVIGGDLKLTAEEIETGLVKPDSSLARLHIKLLKGIPPVSKNLNDTDAWVTAVCKKIAMWWPWVAEGEMPLTVAKGEEIYKYKELEPTTRLLILKALCEIRAEQDDAVSYINDALKNGSEISCFRKNKIGGVGNATSYWYDGGTVIGYRLYKEVCKNESKSKMKGKASNGLPTISFQWETLATNLDEFQKVVDELLSSKVVGETSVGNIIKTDVVPAVEKFQKKKERALKQKERQERLLNDFRSYGAGIARSCRSRRVTYTFDEYDRAIDEAIKISKKGKPAKKIGGNNKLSKQGKLASNNGGSDADMDSKGSHTENSDSDMGTGPKDGNIKKGDSLDSEAESDGIQQDSKGDDNSGSDDEDNGRKSDNYDGSESENSGDMDDEDNDRKSDNYEGSESENSGDMDDEDNDRKSDNYEGSESENSGDMDDASDMKFAHKSVGTRWSTRLAGGPKHNREVETRNLASKNRSRQRPTRNSALETVVLDSEDDSLSDNIKGNESGCEDLSPVADSEDVSDG